MILLRAQNSEVTYRQAGDLLRYGWAIYPNLSFFPFLALDVSVPLQFFNAPGTDLLFYPLYFRLILILIRTTQMHLLTIQILIFT